MFKAKLINNPAYYRVRRYALLLILYPGTLVIVLMANLPIGWMIPIFLVAMGIDLWKIRMHKKMSTLSTGNKIEINEAFIRISKDSGELLEELAVADASGILVKETYAIPADTLARLFGEMKGKVLKNYLIYESGTTTKRYDFVIDSYYQIDQLKQVVQQWQASGAAVGMVEN